MRINKSYKKKTFMMKDSKSEDIIIISLLNIILLNKK